MGTVDGSTIRILKVEDTFQHKMLYGFSRNLVVTLLLAFSNNEFGKSSLFRHLRSVFNHLLSAFDLVLPLAFSVDTVINIALTALKPLYCGATYYNNDILAASH